MLIVALRSSASWLTEGRKGPVAARSRVDQNRESDFGRVRRERSFMVSPAPFASACNGKFCCRSFGGGGGTRGGAKKVPLRDGHSDGPHIRQIVSPSAASRRVPPEAGLLSKERSPCAMTTIQSID